MAVCLNGCTIYFPVLSFCVLDGFIAAFCLSRFLFFYVAARRLEKEVKQVLEEIGHNQAAKERLVRGRQVDLAEELSKLKDLKAH